MPSNVVGKANSPSMARKDEHSVTPDEDRSRNCKEEPQKRDDSTMTTGSDEKPPHPDRKHPPRQEPELSFSSLRALNDIDQQGFVNDQDFLHWVDKNLEKKSNPSTDSATNSHQETLDPLSASAIVMLAGSVRPATYQEVSEQAEDPSTTTPLELEKHGKVQKVSPAQKTVSESERRDSKNADDIRKSVTSITIEQLNEKPTYIVHVNKKGHHLKKKELDHLKAQIAEEIDMDNWETRIRERHDHKMRRRAAREAKKKHDEGSDIENAKAVADGTKDEGHHSSSLPISMLNPGFVERKEEDERLLMSGSSQEAVPKRGSPSKLQTQALHVEESDPEEAHTGEDHIAEMVFVARRKFQDRLRSITGKAAVEINISGEEQ